eukprot:1134116-Pelagomonas_calceolata.AAC.1
MHRRGHRVMAHVAGEGGDFCYMHAQESPSHLVGNSLGEIGGLGDMSPLPGPLPAEGLKAQSESEGAAAMLIEAWPFCATPPMCVATDQRTSVYMKELTQGANAKGYMKRGKL